VANATNPPFEELESATRYLGIREAVLPAPKLARLPDGSCSTRGMVSYARIQAGNPLLVWLDETELKCKSSDELVMASKVGRNSIYYQNGDGVSFVFRVRTGRGPGRH
jgi:hypothetical protein